MGPVTTKDAKKFSKEIGTCFTFYLLKRVYQKRKLKLKKLGLHGLNHRLFTGSLNS